MADENVKVGISTSIVETDEEPFIPSASATISEDLDPINAGKEVDTAEAAASIFAELTPTEQEEQTFYSQDWIDFFNNYIKSPSTYYKALPEYEAPTSELILNVETTGTLPWESRLILISVMDPNVASPSIQTFIQDTEENTMKEFTDWLNSTGYSKLVGFNVAFDFRFLYSLMQKYRIAVPAWPEMGLIDLMTQQKQVKQAFVPGYNKEGTLEQWSTYLFGTQPYAEQKKVFEWLKAGNIDEIVAFNEDKVTKTYFLYTLGRIVAGTISSAVVGEESSPSSGSEISNSGMPNSSGISNEVEVYCPKCGQRQYIDKGLKSINCLVCGTPIANPLA